MKGFAYRPGITYTVFWDETEVLSTVAAGKTPIVAAVQQGIGKLISGHIQAIVIKTSDGIQHRIAIETH